MERTRELQAFRGRNKLIQQLVNRVNVKKLRTLELIKHYWFQSNTSRTLKNYVPQLCYEKIHLSIIQTSEVLPFCLDSLFAFIVFTKQEKSSVKRRWSFHKASFRNQVLRKWQFVAIGNENRAQYGQRKIKVKRWIHSKARFNTYVQLAI